MNLLSNLQFSLHNIFELYKTQGRRWFGFSMLFFVITSIVSSLLTCIVLLVCSYLSSMMSGEMPSFMHVINSSDFMMDFFNYSQLFTLLNMSLFGLFLKQHQSSPEKVSGGAFFRSISAHTWRLYFLLTAGGIAVSRIITNLVTPRYGGSSSLNELLAIYGHYGFSGWLFSIVRLALSIAPVFLAFFLIRRALLQQGLRLDRSTAKTVFFSLLIVSFVMVHFSYDVMSFIQTYLQSLIMIPFVDPWIPYLLIVIVYILLTGVFYPGIAGATIYPFLYRSEETPADDTLTTD